jgi:membrane protein
VSGPHRRLSPAGEMSGAKPPARHGPPLSHLRVATWRGVFVRAARAYRTDGCGDLAAGLTYRALLSVFPALVVVVALAGLVVTNDEAVDTLVAIVEDAAPAAVADAVAARTREVAGGRTAAGVLLSVGLLASLWTASAYLRAFTRAANRIYGVREGRPAYRLVPQQLALTLVGLVLTALVLLGLVVSGPVARAVGDALGLGPTAVTVWNVLKWPVLVLIAATLLSLLFLVAPNVRQPTLRWLAVGGGVALLTWVLASLGFALYLANFSAYDATYGTLGAVIAFLVWMYLANSAILFGVEVNAELARGRRIQAGRPPEPGEPPLPPKVPA